MIISRIFKNYLKIGSLWGAVYEYQSDIISIIGIRMQLQGVAFFNAQNLL